MIRILLLLNSLLLVSSNPQNLTLSFYNSLYDCENGSDLIIQKKFSLKLNCNCVDDNICFRELQDLYFKDLNFDVNDIPFNIEDCNKIKGDCYNCKNIYMNMTESYSRDRCFGKMNKVIWIILLSVMLGVLAGGALYVITVCIRKQ